MYHINKPGGDREDVTNETTQLYTINMSFFKCKNFILHEIPMIFKYFLTIFNYSLQHSHKPTVDKQFKEWMDGFN